MQNIIKNKIEQKNEKKYLHTIYITCKHLFMDKRENRETYLYSRFEI